MEDIYIYLYVYKSMRLVIRIFSEEIFREGEEGEIYAAGDDR